MGYPSSYGLCYTVSMTTTSRTQEQRVRRMALRRGYRLSKSARRDPKALDYGIWYLVDLRMDPEIDRWEFDDIDSVEQWLNGDEEEQS